MHRHPGLAIAAALTVVPEMPFANRGERPQGDSSRPPDQPGALPAIDQKRVLAGCWERFLASLPEVVQRARHGSHHSRRGHNKQPLCHLRGCSKKGHLMLGIVQPSVTTVSLPERLGARRSHCPRTPRRSNLILARSRKEQPPTLIVLGH